MSSVEMRYVSVTPNRMPVAKDELGIRALERLQRRVRNDHASFLETEAQPARPLDGAENIVQLGVHGT